MLSGGILTNGAQEFGLSSGGQIVLNGDAQIQSLSGNITFHGEINGPHKLQVNAESGNISYEAAVGSVTPLGSLNSAGTIFLSAPISARD
jgi:hypothetical protein